MYIELIDNINGHVSELLHQQSVIDHVYSDAVGKCKALGISPSADVSEVNDEFHQSVQMAPSSQLSSLINNEHLKSLLLHYSESVGIYKKILFWTDMLQENRNLTDEFQNWTNDFELQTIKLKRCFLENKYELFYKAEEEFQELRKQFSSDFSFAIREKIKKIQLEISAIEENKNHKKQVFKKISFEISLRDAPSRVWQVFSGIYFIAFTYLKHKFGSIIKFELAIILYLMLYASYRISIKMKTKKDDKELDNIMAEVESMEHKIDRLNNKCDSFHNTLNNISNFGLIQYQDNSLKPTEDDKESGSSMEEVESTDLFGSPKTAPNPLQTRWSHRKRKNGKNDSSHLQKNSNEGIRLWNTFEEMFAGLAVVAIVLIIYINLKQILAVLFCLFLLFALFSK